jgi:hypothetical protein
MLKRVNLAIIITLLSDPALKHLLFINILNKVKYLYKLFIIITRTVEYSCNQYKIINYIDITLYIRNIAI